MVAEAEATGASATTVAISSDLEGLADRLLPTDRELLCWDAVRPVLLKWHCIVQGC